MQKNINIRAIENGEEYIVSELTLDCFNKYIAPEYCTEGIKEFLKDIEVNRIMARISNDHFMLIATENNMIIGIIEIKCFNHISMLFVGETHQGFGIGRKLIDEALIRCKQYNKAVESISVNSSPYAVKFYDKLGFKGIDGERTVHGIRFTPMELRIK